MKKILVLIMCAMLVVGSLAGCSSNEPADKGTSQPSEPSGSGDSEVIKIGVFEPMTGANAAGGEMTVEGIELANKKVSEVLGKKVELVIVDNKSEKVEAANAASKLIDQDKVVAIIGSYGSSLSMSAGDIVKNAEVPAVGCSPTNPLVTLNNDYYFRVCFIDPFQGTVMANYAFNDLVAKTAVIIDRKSVV